MKGLAAMASGKGAKAPAKAPDSAKAKALRSVVEALRDEDIEGAAAALDLAIQASRDEHEEDD